MDVFWNWVLGNYCKWKKCKKDKISFKSNSIYFWTSGSALQKPVNVFLFSCHLFLFIWFQSNSIYFWLVEMLTIINQWILGILVSINFFSFFFPFFRKLVATTVFLPWVLKQRRPTFWRKTFWIRNKHLFESQATATSKISLRIVKLSIPVILILLLFA